MAVERIAKEVTATTGVQISVFGFDTGEGMPPPVDYRDLPHVWDQGFFKMDQLALKQSLTSASLILGDVSNTVSSFLESENLSPIGFVAFDLDYYSSTRAALRLFEGPATTRLPRVYCYFDDIVWPEIACHNEYLGELCAIREFNVEHTQLKVAPIHLFSQTQPHAYQWHHQIYVLHDFLHAQYAVNVTPKAERHTQLPI